MGDMTEEAVTKLLLSARLKPPSHHEREPESGSMATLKPINLIETKTSDASVKSVESNGRRNRAIISEVRLKPLGFATNESLAINSQVVFYKTRSSK